MSIQDSIKEMLLSNGVGDVGFTCVDDGPGGLMYALSIVIPLSDSVINEIDNAPTYSYFHHYRTVNSYIDHLLLKVGLYLQSKGYKYIPIAASQSMPLDEVRTHMGRYSHKKIAVLSSMGYIGKSTLFLHKQYGASVRLGTLFTDYPFTYTDYAHDSVCNKCDICVKACPAGAIKGVNWEENIERSDMFDADKCNKYMRNHFMNIGRGSVCGICIKVCPKNNNIVR